MNRKTYYLTLVLVLALGLLVAPGLKADDYYCDGEVKDDYLDNVIVRSDAECVLNNTTVKGNVEVKKGGALVTKYAYIYGNIQAYRAKFVHITEETEVHGNVQIKKTGRYKKSEPNEDGQIQICESYIYGDVQLTKNYVPIEVGCGENEGNDIAGNLQVKKNYVNPMIFGGLFDYAISIQYNEIDGDLQFLKNRSKKKNGYDPLDFYIYKNRIYGNLQCYKNYPDPIMGGYNFVDGDAEGQCYDLADDGDPY